MSNDSDREYETSSEPESEEEIDLGPIADPVSFRYDPIDLPPPSPTPSHSDELAMATERGGPSTQGATVGPGEIPRVQAFADDEEVTLNGRSLNELIEGGMKASMDQAVQIAREKLEKDYANKKTEKIAALDKFDGEQRKVRPWLMQLDMKWTGNEERFPTEESKLNYAYSFMRGRALDWAEPYIEGKDGYEFKTTAEFKEQIKLAFGDPNPQATAEQRLRKCRQRGQEASSYHTEFQSIVTHLKLDDTAKILYFKHSLDDTIKERFIGRTDIPTTFPAFVQLAIRLDNDIRSFEAERGYRRQDYPRRHEYKPPPYPRQNFDHKPNELKPRTWNNNTRQNYPQNKPRTQEPRSENSTAYTGKGAYYGPGPMEIGAVHARKLTQEEKDQRRKAGLCLRCGKPGHYARDCKTRNQGNQQSTQRVYNKTHQYKKPQEQTIAATFYQEIELEET